MTPRRAGTALPPPASQTPPQSRYPSPPSGTRILRTRTHSLSPKQAKTISSSLCFWVPIVLKRLIPPQRSALSLRMQSRAATRICARRCRI
ncbi:uncharacterized protein MONOS_12530 [Monocercomonoides exilis]|uniref:uncharacterized protein n=1 Tax=Monocercomonoides exilis TaxID=2049356 RepID=UPI00355A0F37|nr:hypothetical protein MONOS_12530 [Monocercomonoides exilis]|eukprot:MONOS_12530.1-p1 / transcript=MONOS_12530.1 / gene=MONOS_12530 / organism=Monocercomonoides_exilis_PA203 / gene_product=unspecified product / transcript_product=unspecified product / location=Mono_scaffold00698:14202-14474(-) / protein_length=91 / sequence_SO=supercontig / SO=protein_coding / is_pseudo=false